MNRLILIGNGFDLAHGLKTDYNSFIIWYLEKSLGEAFNKGWYEDDIIKIDRTEFGKTFNIQTIRSVSDYVNFFYEKQFEDFFGGKLISIKGYFGSNPNPFSIQSKSILLTELLEKCSNLNWVDIENEFYEELRRTLAQPKVHKLQLIENLNLSLKVFINSLESYLQTLPIPELCTKYKEIFESLLNFTDIVGTVITSRYDLIPNKSLILNFNYTPTVSRYFGSEGITNKIEVNHIHGEIGNLNNPLIFGFGDELDNDYAKIELEKINAFFKYIKSFWYFKTSNYHNLIRFIDGREFEVYILGHSCGLSDRTMLNMIFEHTNCKSIRIFYHIDKTGGNNFENLTQEISRHFGNKSIMRRKIVPFDKLQAMPQLGN